MTTVYIENLGELNIYLGLGIQICTGIILGGLIGLDRERKMKAAGIRTNVLICIGATLYTSISILIQKGNGGVADPNRVAAQVVSGIGFLGAGAILRGGVSVIGLTTAATIWVVAAIGVTIGSGFPIVASIFTFTILIVLKLLGPLYGLIEISSSYHLQVLSKGSIKDAVRDLVLNEVDMISEIYEEILDSEANDYILHVYFSTNQKTLSRLEKSIKDLIMVKKVSSIIIKDSIDPE